MRVWPEIAVIGMAAVLAIFSARPHGQYIGYGDGPSSTLDCAKGFQTLVREIESAPGAVLWGRKDEPTRLIQQQGHEAIYIVTNPGHPAHPAIIHRMVAVSTEHIGMATEGCAFGDRQALDDDLRAYAVMDTALGTEFACGLCSNRQRRSPSLERNTPPPPPPDEN